MLYACRNCGGNVVYDPRRKKLVCPYCDSEESQERKMGEDMNVCPSCNGRLKLGTYTSATKCPYCGNYVIQEQRMQGDYEPQLIIPFQIAKSDVWELIAKEVEDRKYVPASFLDEKNLKMIEGSYVPFWTYDYDVHYEYEAIGRKIRTWTKGRSLFTETSEYRVVREMDMEFELIPADASRAMPNDVMDLIEPYTYADLQDFDMKYISGFLSEYYNDNAMMFEPRAASRTKKDAKAIVENSVQGYTLVTPMKERPQLVRKQIRYALFPVWIYRYRYGSKEYPLYVNGQTGKVVGEIPFDYGKAYKQGALWGLLFFVLSCLGLKAMGIPVWLSVLPLLVIGLGIMFVFALLASMTKKGKKTVNATTYVDGGNSKLLRQEDSFIRTYVTEHNIKKYKNLLKTLT
ncbi:MAG: hypothetical protein E7290_03485 [Lachnospiraceae bacterium]|nr:hypothetical protein [Lachnospiraceae bacterium]